MATFIHRRTGRTVAVDARTAERYRQRPDRWTPADLDVPEGTVDEVLEWAGDDPERRGAALTAERAGKNRKTLIEALDTGGIWE